ncbi:MAG TPA: sugar phosphate isomerase/epimerase [Pseudolysinimonas sp.]|jgi:sugar phosphate isomerase/epimerase|nr:sugar phosphate isomerase/epimerase [Pseudolysinimonas sp.]
MISIGMSTSCAFPLGLEAAFRLGRVAGYDGIEVMVTGDTATQTAASLNALTDKYSMPVLAIHAPVLLLTTNVWGRDQASKLLRSAELAAEVGARSVVVHPPFRWQGRYAARFEQIVREVHTATGVEICVENMFPWRIGGKHLQAYSPSPEPLDLDVDHMTLDFSHASLSGRDSLEMAMAMGDRLRHIHLCDGTRSAHEGNMFDEHLAPGRGTQPVAETLQYLAASGWEGQIVAEVVTHKVRDAKKKLALMIETVAFAREHLEQAHALRDPLPVAEGASRGERRQARRLARALPTP